jgi:peptide/nickel transport system substrate-binding protein
MWSIGLPREILPSLTKLLAFVFALGLATSAVRAAETLTIGRATEPSSLDPHFARTGNNGMTSEHIFDRLVATDAQNQLHPALAASWRLVDTLTWEVTLRPGVTFHDGSALSAADVVFSMERAGRIPNSPAPFTGAVGSIAEMTIVDPLILRFRTKQPTPQLIDEIGLVYIVSHQAAAATIDDFNTGKAAIGTGPYRFVEWKRGDRLVLQRNDSYWGRKPDFDTVVLKPIGKDASRVAALLAGDVDLVDQVPPGDVARLKESAKVGVYSTASTRLIYLALDSDRDASPFVTDEAGRKLEKNPLKDPRVRLAIAKMINRRLLVDRLLSGSGEPAGQMVPDGLGGHDATLKPVELDAKGAKSLLAEAGWPNGFGLTLHSSSDRFPADGEVAQAIGQMLARGGLRVNGVVTQPYAAYASAATRREFSAFLFSFGTATSDAAGGLANVLGTFDAAAGTGAFNRSRFSDPRFDALLKEARGAFDPAERDRKLRDAARLAFAEDVGIVPLYWQVVHWAARKGIAYEPYRDESTLAMAARLVK